MSITSEIERIKTNISNAYDKAEEKGATLPTLKNSNNLASTIESITGGGDDWQPQPDWWDIDTILENDTEEYDGKVIFLVKDSIDISKIEILGANKIKTSDGAEYISPTTTIIHTWDISKDKECSLGYKTRYIIWYYSSQNQAFLWSFSNEMRASILGIIYKNCTIRYSQLDQGYHFGGLYNLEFFKLLNCISLTTNAFRFYENIKKIIIKDCQLSHTFWFNNNRFLSNNNINELVSNYELANIYAYFQNCYELREFNSNTENITNLQNFFLSCYNLDGKIEVDLKSATNTANMFGHCTNIKEIVLKNMDKVAYCESMFSECYELVKISGFNVSSLTNANSFINLFNYCFSLKEIELSIPSTINRLQYTFNNCSNLRKIIGNLNFENITVFAGAFNGCESLQDIDVSNIKISGFYFSQCPNLTHESLINILNALYDYSESETTYTITLGSTNLAKLTEDELAIGQDKGWTIN